MPRRVGQGQVHHAAAPLRPGAQQLAERQHPPDDVLAELGPVDPQHELAVADQLAQRGHPGLDVGLRRPRVQRGGVDPERVDVDARCPPLVLHAAGHPTGAQHRLAAADEGIRPAW